MLVLGSKIHNARGEKKKDSEEPQVSGRSLVVRGTIIDFEAADMSNLSAACFANWQVTYLRK